MACRQRRGVLHRTLGGPVPVEACRQYREDILNVLPGFAGSGTM